MLDTDYVNEAEQCKPEVINAILAHRAKQGHNIRLIDGHMRNIDSMLMADILHERTTINEDEYDYCIKLSRNRASVGNALGLERIAKSATIGEGETPSTSESLFIAVSLFGLSKHHINLLDDATGVLSRATLIPFAKTMEKYSQYMRQLKDSVVIANNNLDRWEIVCKRLNHSDGRSVPRIYSPYTPEIPQ